ncbi:MAG: hypothetical protein NTW14_09035 [bacterium]|nr:hypothetical protein [bacterium]
MPGFAQDEPTLGADLGFATRYVWRGLIFDADPVLQPDVWLQSHGLKMTFWGSMDLTDEDKKFQGQFNEWDTYLDFAGLSWKKLSWGGGVAYESFPDAAGNGTSTAEISTWLSGDVPGEPTLSVYWDIWQLHGVYVNGSLSHSLELGPGELGVSTAAGWGDERHNRWSGLVDAGGWLDYSAGVSYMLPVYKQICLCPAVSYSAILQKDIADDYDLRGIEPNAVYFSLTASWAALP